MLLCVCVCALCVLCCVFVCIKNCFSTWPCATCTRKTISRRWRMALTTAACSMRCVAKRFYRIVFHREARRESGMSELRGLILKTTAVKYCILHGIRILWWIFVRRAPANLVSGAATVQARAHFFICKILQCLACSVVVAAIAIHRSSIQIKDNFLAHFVSTHSICLGHFGMARARCR